MSLSRIVCEAAARFAWVFDPEVSSEQRIMQGVVLLLAPLVIVTVTVAYATAARMTPSDSSGPPGPACRPSNAAVPRA